MNLYYWKLYAKIISKKYILKSSN